MKYRIVWPEEKKEEFKNKTFRSLHAVADVVANGELVTVACRDSRILLGFKEVKKEKDQELDTYVCSRYYAPEF